MADHTITGRTQHKEQLGSRPSDNLTPETLLDMFWHMLLTRRVDERAWALHRQGRIAFHISGMGHEACQIAAIYAINRGVDYLVPYYRDLAMVFALGVTPTEFVISLFGKQGEYSSLARQLPSHFGSKRHNIISTGSSVATQIPHAAGLAFAIKYRLEQGLQDRNDMTQPRLALTSIGEGSTSQGEWHEGMNWAGVHNLPFICLVQNNIYAISVPVDRQMAVPDVAQRAAAYGVTGVVGNGNDVFEMYDLLFEAVQRAYRGEGATLVEAKTYRLVPHSSDDDDRSYRSREEVEEWRRKDPLVHFQQALLQRGILTEDKLQEMEQRAKREFENALKIAEETPYPPGEAALADVYAPITEES